MIFQLKLPINSSKYKQLLFLNNKELCLNPSQKDPASAVYIDHTLIMWEVSSITTSTSKDLHHMKNHHFIIRFKKIQEQESLVAKDGVNKTHKI